MSPTPARFLVACFCAAWCRTCDEYKHVMASLKARYAEQVQLVWVDIEDQSELLDNVDIEDFPTLLMSDANHVYFWGPLLPHEATACQVIEGLVRGALAPLDAPEILQIHARLRSSQLCADLNHSMPG